MFLDTQPSRCAIIPLFVSIEFPLLPRDKTDMSALNSSHVDNRKAAYGENAAKSSFALENVQKRFIEQEIF